MKANKKMLPSIAAVILIINTLSLVLRCVSTYHVKSSIFSEISGHFTTLAETVLPLITAVALLSAYVISGSFKKPLLHALIYSLVWFITVFAEYLIVHSYAGYRIGHALLLSAGWSVLMTVTMYAELAVLFFIIIFAARIFANRRSGAERGINEYIFSESAFDFHNPVTVGIFSASALLFFYNLGVEIANTVEYLKSCAGIYTVWEIAYLVFEYLYVLGLLLLSHYIAFRMKSVFIKSQEAKES